MTTKKILVSLFAFTSMSFAIVFGQQGVIKGMVVDQENQQPLIAATLKLGQTGITTDLDGQFSIEISPGKYLLEISYIGYQSVKDTITIGAGQTIAINYELGPSAVLLEAATITSGKYEQSLGEVTVSLDILQPKLVRNTGKVALDGAIEKIPGVTVIDGQANIRGGSGYTFGAGSRVLMLVDDIPILDGASGSTNFPDIPIENIAQIEVVKGAASALYGSSALNGIVNVRTAYATSEPETAASVFYNVTFDPENKDWVWWEERPRTFGASLTHKRKFKKLDLVLGSYYYNEESYNKHTSRKYGRVNFNTQYRVSDRLTIGLNGNFNQGVRSNFFYWASADQPYIPAENTDSRTELTRFNIDPRVTYFDKHGNKHRFLGRYNHVDNLAENDRANFSGQFYGEYQFQRKFTPLSLVLTTGVVGQFTSSEAELYGDTTFTSNNIATYLQLDKKFGDRLNVAFGFRYEYNVLDNPGFQSSCEVVEPSRDEESKPVFRLGASYALQEFTFLRASIGQGYRYPTIAEKYIDTQVGGIAIIPGPGLQSETGWSAELGLKQGFKINSFNGFIDLSGFLMRYQNMMEFNLVATSCVLGFQATNIGDTEIKGLEVSIAGQGNIGEVTTSLLAGYTYIDPRFDDFDNTPIPASESGTIAQINANNSSAEDNILKYRSRHLFKFDAEAQYKKFSLGLAAFRNSRFEAIDATFELIIPGLSQFRNEVDDGIFQINARAAYQITDEIKASLILNNATNEVFAYRPGFMGPPRNLLARLDFNF